MKISKLKIFIAIAAVALAGGVAFWFFFSRDFKTFKSLNFKSLNIETLELFKLFGGRADESATDQRSTPLDQDLTGQVSEKSADMSETYTNPKYGFSFRYSKEFSVSEFTEGEVDIILTKDATGDGFQISIKPFDEPFNSAQDNSGPLAVSRSASSSRPRGSSNPITKERILKDIPNMVISNDKLITLSGASALSFKSKDDSVGETLEIWFVRGGNLYQISAFPSFGDKLEKIIKTWRFQ